MLPVVNGSANEQTSMQELVTFSSGKMNRDPSTNKVTADSRRGTCTFSRGKLSDPSSKEYFVLKWFEKESKLAENSFILFPHTHELKMLQTSTIVGLYKRVSSQTTETPLPPICIFWLQEDPKQFESKLNSMNKHLLSTEPCTSVLSENDANTIRTLMQKQTPNTSQVTKQKELPSIKEILGDPENTVLLKNNIEFYCKTVLDKIPPEVRVDFPPSQSEENDMLSTFRACINTREVRECEDLIQECIDSSLDPAYIVKEIFGIQHAESQAEAEYKEFVTQPSTRSLFNFLVAFEQHQDKSDEVTEKE